MMINFKIFALKHFMLLFFAFVFAYKFKAFVEDQEGMVKTLLTPLMYVVFILGAIYDVFVNHLLTLIFWDFPVGWDETVTQRMQRYKEGGFGWKHRFAHWLCDILNEYDPNHC